MNPFEAIGYWWLPDDPETKLCGTLTFDPETGGKLSTPGFFEDITQMNQPPEYIWIHGRSKSGKEYTLQKCLKTASSINFSGINSAEYDITTILEGGLFSEKEEIEFYSFRIYFSNLGDWLHQIILYCHQTFETDTNKHRYSIEYNPEQFPSYTIEGLGQIEFRYNHEINPQPSHVIHNFTATTDFFVEFTPEKPATLEEILNVYSYQFCNFLSFALQKPSHPQRIIGYISSLAFQIKEKTYPIPIEVFQDLTYHVKDTKRVQPFELLFSYRDIAPRFSEYYANWIQFSYRCKPSLDLFFSLKYRESLFLEDSFQKVIQAIEVFHRRSPLYPEEFCSPEDYEPIWATFYGVIPDSISDDFRESIITKIKYFNQYSLQRRIKDLLRTFQNEYGEIIKEIFGNRSEWAKKVADRRDHFTHHENDKTLEHQELYLWTIQGKLLLNIVIMREIGFEKDLIIEMIKKDNFYKDAKRGGGFVG